MTGAAVLLTLYRPIDVVGIVEVDLSKTGVSGRSGRDTADSVGPHLAASESSRTIAGEWVGRCAAARAPSASIVV
jgi:hypothetical protein